MEKKIKKAKQHLEKLRRLIAQKPGPFPLHMSEEEVIEVMRKTREEIWNKKLVARP